MSHKNHSALAVAEAVDAAVPDPPARKGMIQKLRHQKAVIMVGCCWEMPPVRPSFPEIGNIVGIAHSTAMNHLKEWHSWPWQDRYGWLRLVEGRLAREADALDATLR